MSFEKALAQLKASNARQPKPPAPPPPPERKVATVDAYRQFTQVYSHAVYGFAYGDPKGYTAFLDPEPTVEDLGRSVREALTASRYISPDHPEWDAVIRPPTADDIREREDELKHRAGVKTRKALYNGAGCVAITLQDGEIELRPLRYRGSGGWEGITGHETVRLPEAVPDVELGAAVAAVIEVSRSA